MNTFLRSLSTNVSYYIIVDSKFAYYYGLANTMNSAFEFFKVFGAYTMKQSTLVYGLKVSVI